MCPKVREHLTNLAATEEMLFTLQQKLWQLTSLRSKAPRESIVEERLMEEAVPVLGEHKDVLRCHCRSVLGEIVENVSRRGELLIGTKPFSQLVDDLRPCRLAAEA